MSSFCVYNVPVMPANWRSSSTAKNIVDCLLEYFFLLEELVDHQLTEVVLEVSQHILHSDVD